MNNLNYGGILVSIGMIGLMYSLLLSESSNVTVVISTLSVLIMLFGTAFIMEKSQQE